MGCAPGRAQRPAEAPPNFTLEREPWCTDCPFDDQASLITFDGGYNVAFDASADRATLLALPSWQDSAIMTLFDPNAGWSAPSRIPVGNNPAFGPAVDGPPWLLSDWNYILRLREPGGVEEDVSCYGARFSPAAVDVRDGHLELVAGLVDEAGRRVVLLSRPLTGEEPPPPWEFEDLARFGSGPLKAARDANGQWVVLGISAPHAVLAHDGGEMLIPLEVDQTGDALMSDLSPEALDLVVGETFSAAVVQGARAVTVTFVDGTTLTMPAKRHPGDATCDASTVCGGRCAIRERITGSASVFTAGDYLFIGFVDTSIDSAVLHEDVYCPDSETEVCECRVVEERQEFSSEVVVARFDLQSLHGERIFSVPIPVTFNPTFRAGVLGDRVVFALRGDLEGATRLGTLPLSSLVE